MLDAVVGRGDGRAADAEAGAVAPSPGGDWRRLRAARRPVATATSASAAGREPSSPPRHPPPRRLVVLTSSPPSAAAPAARPPSEARAPHDAPDAVRETAPGAADVEDRLLARALDRAEDARAAASGGRARRRGGTGWRVAALGLGAGVLASAALGWWIAERIAAGGTAAPRAEREAVSFPPPVPPPPRPVAAPRAAAFGPGPSGGETPGQEVFPSPSRAFPADSAVGRGPLPGAATGSRPPEQGAGEGDPAAPSRPDAGPPAPGLPWPPPPAPPPRTATRPEPSQPAALAPMPPAPEILAPHWSPPQPSSAVAGAEPQPPPMAVRVVLHHRPGAGDAAAALARRLPTTGGAGVELRAVPATPGARVVRYFHPADRPAAEALAARLGAGVRDFTHFSPRPRPGTLEAWLPDEPSP